VVPVDEVLGRRKALVQGVSALDDGQGRAAEVCILGDGTMAFSFYIDDVLRNAHLIWKARSDASLGHEHERDSMAAAV
jgi:hypothetical protein